MRKLTLITVILAVFALSFIGGMYVGLGQGVLYALGLEAHGAVFRRLSLENGEIYEGAFIDEAERIIDSNISHFGQHLENHWLIHQIPSPWSLSDAGVSFMRTAIEYRLENPRKNDEKRRSILGQDITQKYLQDQLNSMRDDEGKLLLSEDETVEIIRNTFRKLQAQEANYQRAIEYMKQLNDDV